MGRKHRKAPKPFTARRPGLCRRCDLAIRVDDWVVRGRVKPMGSRGFFAIVHLNCPDRLAHHVSAPSGPRHTIARRPGWCAECGSEYAVGTEIGHLGGERYVCWLFCPQREKASA